MKLEAKHIRTASALIAIAIIAASLAIIRTEIVRHGFDGATKIFLLSMTILMFGLTLGAPLLIEAIWSRLRPQLPTVRGRWQIAAKRRRLEKQRKAALKELTQIGGQQKAWDELAEVLLSAYLTGFNEKAEAARQITPHAPNDPASHLQFKSQDEPWAGLPLTAASVGEPE
jgi:hypothetical protein